MGGEIDRSDIRLLSSRRLIRELLAFSEMEFNCSCSCQWKFRNSIKYNVGRGDSDFFRRLNCRLKFPSQTQQFLSTKTMYAGLCGC